MKKVKKKKILKQKKTINLLIIKMKVKIKYYYFQKKKQIIWICFFKQTMVRII